MTFDSGQFRNVGVHYFYWRHQSILYKQRYSQWNTPEYGFPLTHIIPYKGRRKTVFQYILPSDDLFLRANTGLQNINQCSLAKRNSGWISEIWRKLISRFFIRKKYSSWQIWKQHSKYIENKIAKNVGFKAKPLLNKESLLTLDDSYIGSYIQSKTILKQRKNLCYHCMTSIFTAMLMLLGKYLNWQK